MSFRDYVLDEAEHDGDEESQGEDDRQMRIDEMLQPHTALADDDESLSGDEIDHSAINFMEMIEGLGVWLVVCRRICLRANRAGRARCSATRRPIYWQQWRRKQ